MGDQRRSDQDRAHGATHARDHEDDVATHDGHAGDDHDVAHAHVQARMQPKSDRRAVLPPERAFDGVGDQDALWDRLEALLTAGAQTPGVPAMVRDMDSAHRAQVKARIDELIPITSGDELLIVADTVGAGLREAVTHALACAQAPSASQLRSSLAAADRDLIGRELDDAALIKALRAKFPGSPVAIVPDIAALLRFDELRRWFFAATPAALAALTLVRVDRVAEVAAELNAGGRGAWMWAFHVTDAMAAMNEAALEAYAAVTDQADVAEFLRNKVATREASIHEFAARDREFEAHVRVRAVDPDQLIDDLAVIEASGVEELTRPGRRRAFLATADAAQIDQATTLLNLPPVERMRWLVDGPKVELAALRDTVATWPEEVSRDAFDGAIVKTIRRRWPAAGPADVFGRVPDTVAGDGTHDLAVRRWIVDRGSPAEILAMLVLFPDRTSALAAWMSGPGGGWDWLDRLGPGVDDLPLRRLMLRCDDPALVERIQRQLIGDHVPTRSERVDDDDQAPRGPEDPNAQLDRRVGYQRDGELAQSVGELDDGDAAELRAKPDQVEQVLARTKGASLVRVLYAAEPPVRALLRRKDVTKDDAIDRAQVAGWIRTRPADDVADALADPTAAASAQRLWPTAPLEIFPQLRQPAVLARVLTDNPDILEWIVAHSEPMSALHALGAGPVAAAAAAAFGEDSSLVEWLPSGKLLSSRERSYLYSIARHADGRARRRLDQRIGADANDIEDTDIDERAVGDDRVERAGLPLAAALEGMLDDKVPIEDILVVCRERAGEAAELVAKHADLVRRVLTRAGLAPTTVFPTVGLAQLLAMTTLVEVTLDTTPGFEVVAACAHDRSLVTVYAAGLNQEEQLFLSVIRRLPHGAALAPAEELGLQRLCAEVTSALAVRALFKARFGSGIADSYTTAETKRLWRVMERVPQAHVEHGQVSRFAEIAAGADGEFDPTSKGINLAEGLIDETDGTTINDRTDASDPTGLMTRAEVTAAFELTDAQIDAQIAAGAIEVVDEKLRMAPRVQPDRFTGVALHEIGHAVDDRIGQTSFTNGLAGWRQFGDADFDAWAVELGGWDRVTPDDQRQIRDAWQLWTNSSKAIGAPGVAMAALVGGDHPAVSPAYAADVGIVAFALGVHGDRERPYIANGRAFLMNGLYQQRYSVPVTTMHAAPTSYAMSAPGEYFAECYMTYYLSFDGTPATAAHKGAELAPWIKRWFDANIDTLGHQPRRA